MVQADARVAQNRWKVLVVCPDPAMSQHIRASITELGLTEACLLAAYPRPGTLTSIAEQHECNVCFLDVASNQEQALPLISEASPAIPVVALNPENDADLILRCLRRGASEFLSQATTEQVEDVLDRLMRLRVVPGPGKPGSVYSVLPGKPGCGASTLAAHLAIALKQGTSGNVLLVDGDCDTGSIAFLLKLKSDFHLGDAIRDCLRLDEDLWSRLTVQCHGIDVLTAPENPTTQIPIDHASAVQLIGFWRDHYDAVVLDLPGPHGPGTELALLSDEVLLVTTNELAALHATRRSIAALQPSGIGPDKLKLVVTRYTPATGLKREDVEIALKLAPYAVLSNDYAAVQEGVLNGKPVPPGSAFGRSIHNLVQKLLGKDGPAKKSVSLFGRLRKIR